MRLELIFIVLLIAPVLVARHNQWRRRWLEAREVAERLRVAMPFWMTGVWPHSLSASQPTWTGWYARAILREQPLFSGDIAGSLPRAKALLRAVIGVQYNYHSENFKDINRLDRGLERWGKLFVVGAFLNAFVHQPFMYSFIRPLDSALPLSSHRRH